MKEENLPPRHKDTKDEQSFLTLCLRVFVAMYFY